MQPIALALCLSSLMTRFEGVPSIGGLKLGWSGFLIARYHIWEMVQDRA